MKKLNISLETDKKKTLGFNFYFCSASVKAGLGIRKLTIRVSSEVIFKSHIFMSAWLGFYLKSL